MASLDIAPEPAARLHLPLWIALAATAAVAGLGGLAGSPLVRLLYVGLAVGCAAVWVDKSPRNYVVYTLFLFFFTPMARRIIDLSAGYADVNVTMLAPYLVLALAAPYALAFALGGRRYSSELLALILAIGWGLCLGALFNNLAEVLFIGLRWLGPPFLLGYMLYHRRSLDAGASLVGPIAAFAVLAALYAWVQYAFVPPWDRLWVENSPIGSGLIGIIGRAEPFSMRVFGSLNSPGSLATALAATAAICLALPSWRLAAAGPLIALGLPITLQRSVVGGLALAMLLLILAGDMATRVRLGLLGAALAALLLAAAAAGGDGAQGIVERFAVGSDLASDDSLQARLGQYADFGQWMTGMAGGRGLGWRSALGGDGEIVVLDSGLIEVLVSLGVVAGTGFLVALGSLLLASLLEGARRGGAALGGAAAALLCLAQLPLGATHVGELGVFAFLGLGLALGHEPEARSWH